MCVFKGGRRGTFQEGGEELAVCTKLQRNESWKVLELKMAKCCCAGEGQKCFVSTSKLSQTARRLRFSSSGLWEIPLQSKSEALHRHPAAPKVKVQKLLAAPALCSLTDVSRPLTRQFSGKLIKNPPTISIGTPDVTLGHSRCPGAMGLERGCVQGQR